MAVNQPVFLVYDDAMLAHAHIPHLQKKHPEKPSRITTIYELLGALGLLERCDCATIKPRRATDAEILGAHSAEHLAEVRQMTAEVAAEPENRELREPDGPGGIYYSPEALAAGLLAAGIVVEMSLTLLKLADAERARTAAAPAPAAAVQAQSSEAYAPGGPALAPSVPTPMPPCALALVRPPGHHAGYDDTPGHRAEGFCFFNSVACAAAAAIASGGARRVLIIDYDVHHGNGTEKIFYERSEVLYMSVHRYGRNFYPETGALDDMGEGAGVGYTVNCPWTVTGCGDADYLAAVHLLLLPIARAFDPQLVLVSAGFDAADGDVQGGMRVSPWGFAQLTCALGSLGRPMALALEGGYNQQVTAACVAEVARGLLGDVPLLDPIQCASRQPVAAHAEAQVRAAIALQAVHWPALGEDGHIALVEQYFELSRRHAAEPARSSQRVQAAARPPLAAEPPRGAADGGGGGKAKRAKPAAREEERPGNGAAAQMP